jgi:predicted proteasome-type protease
MKEMNLGNIYPTKNIRQCPPSTNQPQTGECKKGISITTTTTTTATITTTTACLIACSLACLPSFLSA